MPKSIIKDLEFCNEMFEISYPEIGQKALKWWNNPSTNLSLDEIKPQEKERLSKEGYNLGDKPSHLTTKDFRNIVVAYVNRSMCLHKENPYQPQLDNYSFETDETQLLISVAEDNLKEKVINLIKELYNFDDCDYIDKTIGIDKLITKL